jgi:glycosyltransferase involved in cell wall biosynthesis
MNTIEWECEQALRQLEQAGVRVVRRGGCSAIDVARNEMISEALHDEAEAILFIDSDIGFEPPDALRLLARPEPVVSGVYAKKGTRELASIFAGVKELAFGPDAPGPYPLQYAATGFLRVRAGVLRRMITELEMPLCNTHWGRGVWPFFQPLIVPHGQGKWHYLGEDWAFSYRLARIGVTPLADTSIRLWHWGRYGFSWEDAGSTVQRYRSYSYTL